MNYIIIFAKEARYDLDNIFNYYAIQCDNVKYATKLKNKLLHNIESLSFMPERFHLYDNKLYQRNINLRIMIVDKYKVGYHVDKINNVIIIYHIFSSRSNIKRKIYPQ